MQKSDFYKTIAQVISYAFHPLLMASAAVFILFNSGHYLSVVNSDIRDTIYSIFLILTFILPALFIPVLYYFRIITKLEIDLRKERLLPLVSILIIYSLAYYFMQRVSMPPILLKVILSSVVILAMSLLITVFWKISLHTTALGGLLGFVIYIGINSNLNVLFIGFIIIIVSGFVATSRLYL
ncbi:MAG: hypothetical protein C0596_08090 [Marinilabiliales bacterium]|nr:MAG: hypothetical protein C0596_08090 [Marinilabiliales bacterium]